MIDFDATVAKAQTFDTIKDARDWVITIIKDLVDLKQSPGGSGIYKRLLQRIVEPFHKKGKTSFLKEIEGYVKSEEYNRQQDKFEEATNDKQRDQLDTSDNGAIIANQKNIVTVLSNNKFLEFQYSNFNDRKMFRFTNGPIWHEGLERDYLEIKYYRPHRITGLLINRWYSVSGHISELKLYLHQFFPDERAWFELDAAIEVVTKRNQINIYQDWMDNGLPDWDSEEHMDFLYRHAGVKDREWAMIIARLIFGGLVARCYQPGYDFRPTIVLEGDENIGKSWLTKSIAFDERFTTPFEFTKNMNNYEAARMMQGMVIIELADKGGIDSRTPDQIKAFLTMTHDVNRRMRSDDVEHIKRIGIIIITCNESDAYLRSGNEDTRYYTVRCNGKIDVEAIIKELPQIYAQAKHMWDIGVSPRPTDHEMELQQKYIKSRQIKPTYYFYVLDKLRYHRAQMIHDPETNWNDGFKMDEMLVWLSEEDWFHSKHKEQHRKEIQKVMKLFQFENSVRKVPSGKRKDGMPETFRNWHFTGSDFATFIDNLDEE